MLLQCVIEMCVVRNYALAVVFITAAVLTIGTGGQQVTGLDDLLLARGVDTAIGCVVALRVFVLMTRCTATARVPAAIICTLDAVETTAGHLAHGTVTTPEARVSRRELQYHTLALLQAYDASVGALVRQRSVAE
jgi:uncharacterized membrane protein YccC